jgi:hypothetical protein
MVHGCFTLLGLNFENENLSKKISARKQVKNRFLVTNSDDFPVHSRNFEIFHFFQQSISYIKQTDAYMYA